MTSTGYTKLGHSGFLMPPAYLRPLRRSLLRRSCKRQQMWVQAMAEQVTQFESPPPSMSFSHLAPRPVGPDKPYQDAAPPPATRTDYDLILAINNVETLGDLYNLLTRNASKLAPEHYCSLLMQLVELLQPASTKLPTSPLTGTRPADANRVLTFMMPELQRQLPRFETEQLSFLLALLPDLPTGVDKDLSSAICRVVCKCFCEAGRLADCSSNSLAAVVWALAMLRYWNEWTWQQLAQAVLQKLPSFSATELSHTACAFAIAQRYQPQLFDAIAMQAKARLRLPAGRRVVGPLGRNSEQAVDDGLVLEEAARSAAGWPGEAGVEKTVADSEVAPAAKPELQPAVVRADNQNMDNSYEFTSSDLTMLMWSFASVKHYDAALLTAMSLQICIRLEHRPGMQGRDLLKENLTAKFWQRYPSAVTSLASRSSADILTAATTATPTTPNSSSRTVTTSVATPSLETSDNMQVVGAAASSSSRDTAGGAGGIWALVGHGLDVLDGAAATVRREPAVAAGDTNQPSLQLSQQSSQLNQKPGSFPGWGAAGRWGPTLEHQDAMAQWKSADGNSCSTSAGSSGDTFHPVEVAQLAWSYAQLRYHDKALFGWLAESILRSSSEYTEKDLYDILMAYTWVQHHDSVLIKRLCACLAPTLHLLPQANLTALMYTLARAHKHRPWEVYTRDFWQAAAQLLPARTHDLKFGEMAKLVWALAALRHYDAAVLEAVASQVPLKCNAAQPGGLAMMVQAYATLNCYHPVVFGAVAQTAQRRLSDFNCFQLGALAGAFALVDWQDMAIFQAIYKRLHNINAAMFDEDPDALRQLIQADLLLCHLHPNTPGRPILPPQFLQRPKRRRQGKVKTRRRVSPLTAELYRALARRGIRPTLGAPTEEKLMSIDLSFRWRNKFDVAWQAGSHHCYTLSEPHLPLGATRAGQRLLEARGWRILAIPFFKWATANGDLHLQDRLLDDQLANLM